MYSGVLTKRCKRSFVGSKRVKPQDIQDTRERTAMRVFATHKQAFRLSRGKLALSKIGHIKIKLYREIVGTIKTATIKREGEHWYVTLVCEVEQVKRTPYTDDAVGIDLGVSKLATLSTGDVIENPKHYRKCGEEACQSTTSVIQKETRFQ